MSSGFDPASSDLQTAWPLLIRSAAAADPEAMGLLNEVVVVTVGMSDTHGYQRQQRGQD